MTILHPRRLLTILAAMMLLMQSFAIWHDAEHAFHDHVATCERFEAISHLPVVDTDPFLTLAVVQALLWIEASLPASLQIANTLDNPLIRGPPLTS